MIWVSIYKFDIYPIHTKLHTYYLIINLMNLVLTNMIYFLITY